MGYLDMKIKELLEAVAAPPSKDELQLTIDRIKELKADIDALAAKDEYNPELKTSAKDRRRAKDWQDNFQEAHWRLDFAHKLHDSIIPKFNDIVKKSKEAEAAKDVAGLKDCLAQLKQLVIDEDLIKLARRVSKRDWPVLKAEEGYPAKTAKAIDHILAVRDSLPKRIIAAGRSDVENARAAKASAAMKARWGI